MQNNAYKLFLNIKMVLYFSDLVMKLFNNTRKLFLTKIIIMKQKTNLLLDAMLCIHPFTYITKALHLVATVKHISLVMLCY